MAKSNAERQAEYRKRCRERSEGYTATLHTQLNYSEKRSLEALAKYYGLTQREMLERLIKDCYLVTTKGLTEEEIDRFDSLL